MVFSLGVLKYVVCFVRGAMDGVVYICIVTRVDVGARVWCLCMSGSPCRWCMPVSCVHPVAVLNSAINVLMLVMDTICDHMEEAYFRIGLTTTL